MGAGTNERIHDNLGEKMNIPTMQVLLEAGVHFGHQVRKWHPKMAQFIFSAKDGVHIIDLEKTVDKLGQACKFAKDIASKNGTILFVGTKRQAAEIIKTEAQRADMPYICERWIGGLITNFSEIYKNIEKLANLETKRTAGEFEEFTKKERLLIDREIAKLDRLYGGLRGLDKIPDAIFVVDVKKEETACREAQRREVPVVAICDTNANLDLVDYPVPGNDDAVKSIKILVQTIADAIVEGRGGVVKKEPPSVADSASAAASAEEAAMEGKEEKEEKEEVKKQVEKVAKPKKEIKTKKVQNKAKSTKGTKK